MTQQKRYSRIEAVEMIGAGGLASLRRKRVAVLGAGNLGGALLAHLAVLGIEILLIDRDVVDEENLATQMFAEDFVGLPKVQARKLAMLELNSGCRIEAVQDDVERLGLGAFAGVDLVFCCLDARSARARANELAMRAGRPLVDGALDGSGKAFFGRVAAYHTAEGTACYLCPYDREALGQIPGNGSEACPVFTWSRKEAAPATIATSALGSAVAAQQFVWGLMILLERGKEVLGKEVYFDLERAAMTVHRLAPNPLCVLDHRALTLTPMGRGAGEITVGETFHEAERLLRATATLELHGRSVVTELRCPACGAERHPNRLLEAMTPAEAACACGATAAPPAHGLLERFGLEQAREFAGETWAELGVPPQDVITATGGDGEIHLLLS